MAQEHRSPKNGRADDVDRSPEQIHAEMRQTRASLADKIDALECKVDAVKAKVEHVKDSVRHAGESVKRGFDLPHQVREHPWPALGASVVAGFVLGSLTGGSDFEEEDRLGRGSGRRSRFDDEIEERPRSRPGLFSEELRHLRLAAVGAMMSLVRNGLRETFPGVAPHVDRAVDGLTRKLGGEPIENLFEAPAG